MKFDAIALRIQTRQRWAAQPELREGQAMWHVAEELWPELVESLRATEYDPFYDDKRCFDFMAALQIKTQEAAHADQKK